MKRSALVSLGVLLACIMLVASGTNQTADEAYHAFLKQLRGTGATVVGDDMKYVSDFSGEAHHLTVNGGWVEVYAYAQPEDASADAACLSPDGGTFHRDNSFSISDWVIPPHFFKKDRLIVLYVGSDSQLLKLLTSLLGPQFAGWSRASSPG